MKYFLIMNPGSRGGASESRFRKIFERLDRSGVEYEYQVTRQLDDAYRLSREANLKSYDIITAVGGDGTINQVLNGFFDESGKRISTSKMAVIYTGTSPDFCKSYHIPYMDLNKTLEVLIRNKSRSIPIGKIRLSKRNPETHISNEIVTRYFACCANIGLGATLAEYSNSGIRKYIGDGAGTFVSLLRTLKDYRPSGFEIVKDGEKQTLEGLFNLSIGLTTHVASGIKVRNELKENDGRFYHMAIQKLRLIDLFACFQAIYSGKKIRNNRFIRLDYCSSIEVSGNAQSPMVEFDGDPQGYLPCRIQMAEDRLDLITGGNDVL